MPRGTVDQTRATIMKSGQPLGPNYSTVRLRTTCLYSNYVSHTSTYNGSLSLIKGISLMIKKVQSTKWHRHIETILFKPPKITPICFCKIDLYKLWLYHLYHTKDRRQTWFKPPPENANEFTIRHQRLLIGR